MKDRLRRLEERIDRFSLRERLLMFAAVIAVAVGLWVNLLLTPLEVKQDMLSDRQARVQEEIRMLHSRAQLIAQRAGNDPDAALKQQVSQLEERVHRLDGELVARTTGFVPPRQMAPLLKDLLRRQPGLEIVELKTLEPEPLKSSSGELLPVYRHGLSLEFEGDYLNTLRYLQAIEELPWRLRLDGLDYEVTEWPRARIRLHLHTLSLKQVLIGV